MMTRNLQRGSLAVLLALVLALAVQPIPCGCAFGTCCTAGETDVAPPCCGNQGGAMSGPHEARLLVADTSPGCCQPLGLDEDSPNDAVCSCAREDVPVHAADLPLAAEGHGKVHGLAATVMAPEDSPGDSGADSRERARYLAAHSPPTFLVDCSFLC